jgi:hypothetical protein
MIETGTSEMEGPMFYFPAPPPRVRTRLEFVLAPLRWLIGGVILVILSCLFFWCLRWLWSRQGIVDLRRWAFAKRVSEEERDAFIRGERTRMEHGSAPPLL